MITEKAKRRMADFLIWVNGGDEFIATNPELQKPKNPDGTNYKFSAKEIVEIYLAKK